MTETAPPDQPAPAEDPPRSPDHVQSLARGLAVIRAFDGESGPLSLSEVARRCDLTRAAARRFLITLADLGYVRQTGRDFTLRPRVLELGFSYLSGLDVVDVARPHLEELSHELDESASISVLDGREIVYVARVPTRRIMSVSIAVGTRFPAYATSMGRVLLAALPDDELDAQLAHAEAHPLTDRTATDAGELRRLVLAARRHGHAIVDQELEAGLRSAAVPLRDPSGSTVAAMNVSTHAGRTSVDDLVDRVVPRLRLAADAIGRDLARVGGAAAPRR
jgi:IclR family pca regulon transcriptional regulator